MEAEVTGDTEIKGLSEDISMHTVAQADLPPKQQKLTQIHHTAEHTPHNWPVGSGCLIIYSTLQVPLNTEHALTAID